MVRSMQVRRLAPAPTTTPAPCGVHPEPLRGLARALWKQPPAFWKQRPPLPNGFGQLSTSVWHPAGCSMCTLKTKLRGMAAGAERATAPFLRQRVVAAAAALWSGGT
eukprot:TRINITY_DN115479_c0_g1_i1.p3 TRINITY_DN115479_c0_g1~~TRINITY_DN115479_c0_g1_i1.p3  ORF type:complete len:107 (-),score=13.63 TRINITY_DN115479_c0_g1_i1:36-356(-)